MLRHERQTVAMELAAALHHSRGGGPGTHDGLRAQTTASSGTRPAPLSEVVEPQGLSAAPRCPDAGVPLLSVPLLSGGDGNDNTTVRWLLKVELRKRQKEEKEKEEKEQEVSAELRRRAQTHVAHAASLTKRKRKKKRKRKLPRNSSCPRLAARHLGRYGLEGHLCRDTETASVARAVRT